MLAFRLRLALCYHQNHWCSEQYFDLNCLVVGTFLCMNAVEDKVREPRAVYKVTKEFTTAARLPPNTIRMVPRHMKCKNKGQSWTNFYVMKDNKLIVLQKCVRKRKRVEMQQKTLIIDESFSELSVCSPNDEEKKPFLRKRHNEGNCEWQENDKSGLKKKNL